MRKVRYVVRVEQPLALNSVEIECEDYEDALQAYDTELKKLQYKDTVSIIKVTEEQIKHCRDGEEVY